MPGSIRKNSAKPIATHTSTPMGVLPTPDEAMLVSRVRPRFPIVPVAWVGGAVLLASVMLGDAPNEAARIVQKALGLMVLGAVIAVAIGFNVLLMRRIREEDQLASRVDEMLRIRNYDAAVWMVSGLLSRPMLAPISRVRTLFSYVGLLGKLGRYDDVAKTVDYMLADGVPDAMIIPLRGAKAYALLREDRLMDADRAINDVKKMGRGGYSGAVLALTEHYRDARTGHANELLDAHLARRKLVAEYAGTRVADADALAAWAAVQLSRLDQARFWWRRATSVGQLSELLERYPELRRLVDILPPTSVPAELAGPLVNGAMPGGVR